MNIDIIFTLTLLLLYLSLTWDVKIEMKWYLKWGLPLLIASNWIISILENSSFNNKLVQSVCVLITCLVIVLKLIGKR